MKNGDNRKAIHEGSGRGLARRKIRAMLSFFSISTFSRVRRMGGGMTMSSTSRYIFEEIENVRII